MESRGGTGQPDRAASLVGCTEGRQLPAGLPPPRIIRDEGEKEKESSGKRHLEGEGGGKGGQRERVKRVVARVRVERASRVRPARKVRRKKRALKEARCVKLKSCKRKREREGRKRARYTEAVLRGPANIISATPGIAINPARALRPSRRGPPALISGSISEIDAGVAADIVFAVD